MTRRPAMPRFITAITAALLLAGGAHAQTQLTGRIEHVDAQVRIIIIDGSEHSVSVGAPVHGTPSDPGRLDALEAGMDVVVSVLDATPGSRRGLITSVTVRPR